MILILTPDELKHTHATSILTKDIEFVVIPAAKLDAARNHLEGLVNVDENDYGDITADSPDGC